MEWILFLCEYCTHYEPSDPHKLDSKVLVLKKIHHSLTHNFLENLSLWEKACPPIENFQVSDKWLPWLYI